MGRPSGKHLTEDERQRAREAMENGAVTAKQVAERAGIGRRTAEKLYREFHAEKRQAAKPVTFPSFVTEGDEDEPIELLIQRQRQSYERRRKAADARRWFPIHIHESKPYGILWMGDPHLDNPGCNWPLLERHIEIARQTGVYGGNIGDTTDSWPWTGRLARLWAEAEVSDKQSRRMAEWFMFDSGVRWLLWLMGNHDEWNGGTEFYKRLGAELIPIIDWRAQFVLKHDSGTENRIDAAHGRKGNSIYNVAHSTLRAAKFGEAADLYVTGHTHSFALVDHEDPDRHQLAWLAQVRGYKEMDHHATVNSYAPFRRGAAILSVHDPETGAINCFADPEEGADYLKWKRR